MNLKILDQRLTDRLVRWGKPQLRLWQIVAGNGMWLLALAATILVGSGRLHVLHLFLPLLLAYATTLALQNIIGRERPRTELVSDYKLWYRTFSSPSAHAMTSAAYATVLAGAAVGGLGARLVLICFLAILTVLIGISRIVVGVHYFFDVLLGLFLGLVFGLGYILALM